MAVDYQAAKKAQSAEYLKASKMGTMARLAVRAGVARGTAFGLRQREKRRGLAREGRRLALKGVESMVEATNSSHHLQHASYDATTLQKAMSMAREYCKLEKKRVEEKVQQSKNTISDFERGMGQEALKFLHDALPCTRPFSLSPVASEGAFCFQLHTEKEDPLIAKTLSWASGKGTTNLTAALAADWRAQHISVKQCDALPAPHPETTNSICLEAGLCLCSQEGKLLKKLRDLLMRSLRSAFAERFNKQLLHQGFIVAHIAEVIELWLHAALLYLKPLRVTWHVMTKANPSECLPEDVAGGKDLHVVWRCVCLSLLIKGWIGSMLSLLAIVVCQATNVYHSEYEALQQLTTGTSWNLQWWKLENTGRPLSRLKSGQVTVLPFGSEKLFWPPEPKKRGVRRMWQTVGAGHPQDNACAEEPSMDPVPDNNLGQFSDDAASSDDADMDEEDWCAEGEHEEEEEANFDLLIDAEESLQVVEGENLAEAPEHLPDHDGASFHEGSNVPEAEGALFEPASENVSVGEAIALPASSAEVAIEVPVPKSVPRAIGARGVTFSAEAYCHVAGGKISFYPSKDMFEAVCSNKTHQRCVLSRTCHSRVLKDKRVVAGRPLGLMLCWLAAGHDCTRAGHRNKDTWNFSHDQRAMARTALSATLGGRDLLACERAKLPTEDEEPQTLEGLV
eukprot:6490258-Amphidinium_carterae.1